MARPADRLAPYTSFPGTGVTPTVRSADADDILELARLRWQLYTERETHDEPLETYLRTVILGGHVERLPETERDVFVREVAGRMAEPVIDYVRLNIVARRG